MCLSRPSGSGDPLRPARIEAGLPTAPAFRRARFPIRPALEGLSALGADTLASIVLASCVLLAPASVVGLDVLGVRLAPFVRGHVSIQTPADTGRGDEANPDANGSIPPPCH